MTENEQDPRAETDRGSSGAPGDVRSTAEQDRARNTRVCALSDCDNTFEASGKQRYCSKPHTDEGARRRKALANMSADIPLAELHAISAAARDLFAGSAAELAERITELLGRFANLDQGVVARIGATEAAAAEDALAREHAEQDASTEKEKRRAADARVIRERDLRTKEHDLRLKAERDTETAVRERGVAEGVAKTERQAAGEAKEQAALLAAELAEVRGDAQVSLKRITALDEELAAQRDRHRDAVSEQDERHRSVLAEQDARHSQERAAQNQRHDQVLADIRRDHAATLERLDHDLAALRMRDTAQTARIDTLQGELREVARHELAAGTLRHFYTDLRGAVAGAAERDVDAVPRVLTELLGRFPADPTGSLAPE